MAPAVALFLAVLAGQCGVKPKQYTDGNTDERLQQREEFLRQETTHLLEEIEGRWAAEEAPLLSVVWQQLYSKMSGVLVLIAVVCCLAWKLMHNSDSFGKKEEDNKEEKDLGGAHKGVTALDVLTPSPVQGLPDMCKAVEELVGDLLGICRVLSKKSYMPQIYPAIETDGTWKEAWNVHEDGITYRLQVRLQPPPGHSFRLEPDTTGQPPARRSIFRLEPDTTGQPPARRSIFRVVTECSCFREQQLGDVFCFLHHTEDQLPKTAQSLYRLHTLCTGCYLDVEKISSWVQLLVRSAWLLLPQSHYFQLTVLPASHSFSFLLTNASKMNICIEMKFAVQTS